MQVVLERRAGKKQALARVQFTEALRNLALLIFDFVRLIDDDILPFKFLERTHAHADAFKRR